MYVYEESHRGAASGLRSCHFLGQITTQLALFAKFMVKIWDAINSQSQFTAPSSDTNILKSQPNITRNKLWRDVWSTKKNWQLLKPDAALRGTPHVYYAPFLKSKMTTFNLLFDPKVVTNLEKFEKFSGGWRVANADHNTLQRWCHVQIIFRCFIYLFLQWFLSQLKFNEVVNKFHKFHYTYRNNTIVNTKF